MRKTLNYNSISVRCLIICCLLIPVLHSYSQKQGNVWCFGINAAVDFSCNPPKPFHSKIHSMEGTASIASPSGQLLFYTDGDSVWDRNNNLMPNGVNIGARCSGFGSQSGSQSCLIVPVPGDSTRYYIFTTDCFEDNYANGFRYSLVDLTLNGGNGDVLLKDQLLHVSTTEKVAGVFHANQTDVWVLTHELNTNTFLAYLITNSGISSPVISTAGQVHNSGRCYLKFSADGSKLVSLVEGLNPELFSFDNSTGIISADYVLPDPDTRQYYGASFSPDNHYLYLSCVDWICGSRLHQYDLLAGSPLLVMASKYIVAEPLSSTEGGSLGALQLASDGKIYFPGRGEVVNGDFVSYLGVIGEPNNPGPLVEYNPRYIALRCNTNCGYGLPDFIESYFKVPVAASGCPNNSFSFTANACSALMSFSAPDGYQDELNVTYQWNFGDAASGPFNFDSGEDPVHEFSSFGTFPVTLIITYCNDADTIEQNILIEDCEADSMISAPNVFTPNGDHTNDVWQIKIANNKIQNASVYNRWGNLVSYPVQKDNYLEWDGTTAQGEKCPDGVYFYLIEYTNVEGKSLTLKGCISLFR